MRPGRWLSLATLPLVLLAAPAESAGAARMGYPTIPSAARIDTSICTPANARTTETVTMLSAEASDPVADPKGRCFL